MNQLPASPENFLKSLLYEYQIARKGEARKSERRRLSDSLKRLTLYCQPPKPGAERATDPHELMKQFTWWPDWKLLTLINEGVLTLAGDQRKQPSKKRWKAFELVNRRNPKLRLLKQINELVDRARERFTEAGFSDLESLEPDWSKLENFSDVKSLSQKRKQEEKDLFRDIHRTEENAIAARGIDWAQYKGILARLPGGELIARTSDNGIALACYARVLELIIDHDRWEKLRKESKALVSWLLEIGHPEAGELKTFNRSAALMALHDEDARIQDQRAAKIQKFRDSKKIVKRTEQDIEDVRLMEQVRLGNAQALAQLRDRHQAAVRKTVKSILRGNSAVEDIVSVVFAQVWKAAAEYVPIAKFTTWLLQIAKNLALNEKKRAKKEKERIELQHITRAGSKGTRRTATGDAELYSGYASESYGCDGRADDLSDDVADYFRSFND